MTTQEQLHSDGATPMGPGLLEAVWRFRWMVAGMALLAAVTGYGLSLLQPTMYEATARLLLADPRNAGVFRNNDNRITLDPSRYVRNQAQFVSSRAVAGRAAEILDDGTDSEEILQHIKASPSLELDLIEIHATAPDAEEAARLANAVAQAYQERVSDEVQANAQAAISELEDSKLALQTRIDAAERGLSGSPNDSALKAERDASVSQLITIEGRANQIAVDASLYGSGVELSEEAELPESPAQPKPLRNAAVALVLGLMGAAALAWWRAERQDDIDDRHEPARILGAPLLGEIPLFESVGVEGALPTQSAPHSPAAEAFQFVVSSLQFALEEIGARSVLVTSAGPSDGKTVTALNLAIAAVQDGRRVLLVDADERMRELTHLSGLNPSPGLTDLHREQLSFQDGVGVWAISERVQLPVVTAGSVLTDPAGYFRSADFRRAMSRVKASADLVVVDSPPLLAVSDASAIASQVDAVLLVVNNGTSQRVLEEVRHRLDFVGTPLVGYVFNRAVGARGGYGYGYGYGYGRRDEAPDPEPAAKDAKDKGRHSARKQKRRKQVAASAEAPPRP